VQDLLNETLWPDQPLGRPLTGTEKTLGALRREDLIRFKEQNYVTRGTLIAVAGNIDHETARKAASKFGKKFSKANRRGFEPAVCQQDAPRLRLHKKETEQTQLALALRTCSRHDERRFALRLLNVMLGENMSSRLFQVVREDNGLAYSICSSLGFFDDVGTLTISAGVETERLEKALKLIMGELALFIRQSPSAAELRRARDYIFGQLDLSLENTENQMTWLGEHYLGYGKIISPEEVKTQLAEVTPGQIRAVARDFFAPDRLGLALVSPIDKPADVRAIVSRFEP
jgi:predicted Zn-dependent peptidase